MSVEQLADQVRIERPSGDLDPMGSLHDDVRIGFSRRPKTLPSKYHYDGRGSELFVRITEQPEYYPTRVEAGILDRIAESLIATTRPKALVEYGSGAAHKTRILLDAMHGAGRLEAYGAVEVSEPALLESAADLTGRYPDLSFVGVLADFEAAVALPFETLPRLIFFLGSTIGNLENHDAVSFLTSVARQMGPDDRFMVGFDLVKETEVLVAAYNDAAGVTAEFSLNVLTVLNRELDGDVRVADFRHQSIWNAGMRRIEAYLIAERDVDARFAAIDMDVHFDEGEAIRTELSHKYTRATAEGLLAAAGLHVEAWETDPRDWFALAVTRTA